jgi:hypothetical protein
VVRHGKMTIVSSAEYYTFCVRDVGGETAHANNDLKDFMRIAALSGIRLPRVFRVRVSGDFVASR